MDLHGHGKIVEALAYPGQSEKVRIGLGRTAWVKFTGEDLPRSISLTWRDKPYPAATCSPRAFMLFYPEPGSLSMAHEYEEVRRNGRVS